MNLRGGVIIKNLSKVAVKYAEKGLSVLPMSIDKKPLIKFADQPPLKPAEVEALWKKYPFALIAIRTDDFFVIDIDRHEGGADGFKSIDDFKTTNPGLLTETLAQKTAGGGMQLFYFKRNDMKIRQNIGWLPGVDVKANNNNYVLIAPSERKGKQYKWINPQQSIMTAPKELVKKINYRPFKKRLSTSSYTRNNEGVAGGDATKLLIQVANGLGDNGVRNDSLAKFVGTLLYLNIDPDTSEELARQANQHTPDPLPEHEFIKTFNSILKTELRKQLSEKGG